MKAGYGRGYYGDGQLAPKIQRRGGGWTKLALVVGVGAVIWLMWPRKYKPDLVTGDGSRLPPPPEPQQLPPALPQVASPIAQPTSQVAEARGYPSQQAYEDAVVASARQLQDAGAQVVLAPHLQHLAARLA